MSDHPSRPCLEAPEALIDDLASALRRRDAGDADRHLAAWARAEMLPDDVPPWDDVCPIGCLEDDLTAWVHGEIGRHVAGGRFEHALCLLERYRRQAATLTNPVCTGAAPP